MDHQLRDDEETILRRLMQRYDPARNGDHSSFLNGAATALMESRFVLGRALDDLRAENQRLRGRIHEAVDECQRRYAPDIKELARLRNVREIARRHYNEHGDKSWAYISEVQRAYIADLTAERDALAATIARYLDRRQVGSAVADREFLGSLVEFCDESEADGRYLNGALVVYTDDLRRLLARYLDRRQP